MKMNYHLKNNSRGRKEYTVPLYTVVIFGFILFSVNTLFPTFFPAFFSKITYPFYKTERALAERSELIFLSKEELLRENEELKLKIIEMENKQWSFKALVAENNELKELFGRSTGRDTILASILVKPPVTLYDTLILDIGEDEGIRIGDIVLAHGGIFIGEIVEVNANTSKVKLYSSPGETYDIKIGESNIQTTATGRGNGNFEAIVPREITINEGDSILIPSINTTLFGTVSAIIGDPSRAFKTVLFKMPVNIQEISWVLIDRGNREESQ